MTKNTNGTDHKEPGVTRRGLLAAGAVGFTATITQNVAADGEAGIERKFEGESGDGKLQAALDKALERLDKALNEGGVRDATATWKLAAISGVRGTFKEGRTVKVVITATRDPRWEKK